MDWSVLEDAGLLLMKIKMYPYFDIAHYVLMCLVVRDDIHSTQIGTSPYFHKKHPLACWLSSMLLCFGGGLLAHFLLGEPILDDFKTHQGLLTATIAWYLVFYSPFDIFYKIIKFLPIKIVLCGLKEVQRTRKIFDGVNHAQHLVPNAYIIIVIIGAIKGSGSGFLSVIDRFVRGVWVPNSNEILYPSFATKGCLLSAILFLLERKSLINVPRSLLFFCIVAFFVYVKIVSLFFKSFDPFVPFENLFSAVFFGGLLDAFRKANVNSTNTASTNAQTAAQGSTLLRKDNGLELNKLNTNASNIDQDGKLKDVKKNN